MTRMLGWTDLDEIYGHRKSKSQTRRLIKQGRFPAPAGYNGMNPFWLDEQMVAYIRDRIAEQAAKPKAA